jgi:quinol monooxygenase YgiN
LESTAKPYENRGKLMSVIMTLNVTGDPKKMEQFASENKEKMQAVLGAAKGHGLIAHRFYGSDDGGRLMVVDEWPDRQSFESFLREQQAELGPMMEAAGVTSPPEPACWNELATHDAFGWGA